MDLCEKIREGERQCLSVVHNPISRRMLCENGTSALYPQLLPGMAFGFAADSAATSSGASGPPTLDELGTGWLDCGLLAQMPSLHNFHEMAACAPDLVGVSFLAGGQLYGDESAPRWPICY